MPQNAVGSVAIAPHTGGGITVAAHRGPANEFTRGATNELLVVAQRNITASSVRFDLGWGWREHFFHDPRPVYVIPAEASARWRLDGESQCVYLAMDAASVPALLEELGVSDPEGCIWTLAARGFDEALVHEMVERMWRDLNAATGCPSLLVDSYRIAILHALANRAATLRALPGNPASASLARRQLRDVLEYIDAHLGEPLTVRSIADIAGVSVFHFSRLFRNATGRGPYAFVMERRLIVAADRLRNSGEAVAQIAAEVGFPTPSRFTKAFAKQHGCSPRQFRQQWQSRAAEPDSRDE